MEKRQLGNTDMQVSLLGFGGAETGFSGTDVEIVAKLLGTALDAGLNILDSAECYGNGEELIGNAVSHRRKDYYLFTKCGHSSGFDLPDWDVKMLEQSIERSLLRLKTDYVDLIQLHSCSEETLRNGEVIEVLQRARAAGKARYIGYSGDNEAAHYAIECGAFDTLQTSVSIADQCPIGDTLRLAKEKGMGVIAKRPIGNAVWREKTLPENGYYHPYWHRIQELKYDFLAGDLAESFGVALRFTASLPEVGTMIVGTTQPGRWEQNAKLLSVGNLSTAQFEAIRARWKEVAREDWIGQG